MDKDKKKVWKKLTHVPTYVKPGVTVRTVDFSVVIKPGSTDFTVLPIKK